MPDGKYALVAEAMTRSFERHKAGIEAAIHAAAPDDLRGQLVGIAAWLLSQPPIDMVRMSNSDFPALDAKTAVALENEAYFTTMVPVEQLLEQAQARGEIEHSNMGNIGGAYLSAIQGIHAIPTAYIPTSRLTFAEEIIDVLLRGIRKENHA